MDYTELGNLVVDRWKDADRVLQTCYVPPFRRLMAAIGDYRVDRFGQLLGRPVPADPEPHWPYLGLVLPEPRVVLRLRSFKYDIIADGSTSLTVAGCIEIMPQGKRFEFDLLWSLDLPHEHFAHSFYPDVILRTEQEIERYQSDLERAPRHTRVKKYRALLLAFVGEIRRWRTPICDFLEAARRQAFFVPYDPNLSLLELVTRTASFTDPGIEETWWARDHERYTDDEEEDEAQDPDQVRREYREWLAHTLGLPTPSLLDLLPQEWEERERELAEMELDLEPDSPQLHPTRPREDDEDDPDPNPAPLRRPRHGW